MSPRMKNIKFYDSPMGCMMGVLIYPYLFIVIAYLWPFGKFINIVNPMNIANNKMSRSVTWFTYRLMAPAFPAGFSSLNLSWSIEWCVVYVLEQLGLLLFICGYEAKLIKPEWLWVPAAQTSGLTVIMLCNLHTRSLSPFVRQIVWICLMFVDCSYKWIKAKNKNLPEKKKKTATEFISRSRHGWEYLCTLERTYTQKWKHKNGNVHFSLIILPSTVGFE